MAFLSTVYRSFPAAFNRVAFCHPSVLSTMQIRFQHTFGRSDINLPDGRTIIRSFRQGPIGNCVSIAAIKASMDIFGVPNPNVMQHLMPNAYDTTSNGDGSPVTLTDSVFHQIDFTVGSGYQVILRNRELDANGSPIVLDLSEEELATSNRADKFILLDKDDPDKKAIFTFSQLAYAIMAKNAQRLGNDGAAPNAMSYEDALKSLDSDRYDEGPVWIGLDRHVLSVSKRLSRAYPGVICHSSKHCFFVSHGYRDQYGTPSRKKVWNVFSRFFPVGTNLRIVP